MRSRSPVAAVMVLTVLAACARSPNGSRESGSPADQSALAWLRQRAEASDEWAAVFLARAHVTALTRGEGSSTTVVGRSAGALEEAAPPGWVPDEALAHWRMSNDALEQITPSAAEALRWYTRAAELGNRQGMCSLGWLYDHGVGVGRDCGKAAYWYRRAADAANPLAMANLGWMYYEGCGVEQDDVEAVAWYRRAAESGERLGMTLLGRMYEEGRGVEASRTAAIEWYRRAGRLDDPDAIAALERLGERP